MHNKPHTAESCGRISLAMQGRKHKLGYQTSPETRDLMRASSNTEGRHELAYRVVRQIFKTMYPRAQPVGIAVPKHDYVLDGMKISVRGATLNRAHRWHFTILKNTVPDRFFLMLFDSRASHNLLYAFCIPGSELNHLTGVSISEKTIGKWAQWTMDIQSDANL